MASENIIPAESGHWYKPDGTPMYEVPYKDPTKGMRKTTLSDARKMGLLPSVTTILGIIAKEGLMQWKLEQMLLACLTSTRLPDESEELWVQRIVKDSKDVSRSAADRGTRTHAAIDQWITSQEITDDEELFDALIVYIDWHRKYISDVIYTEVPFGCDAGYGGKCDLVANLKLGGRTAVIDLKTKTTKKGQKIVPYVEWGMQLAAYERGLILPEKCRLLNVVISTTEPNRIEVFDWTDSRDTLYRGFYQAFNLWRFLRDYDPTGLTARQNKLWKVYEK
ncbi:MAG: hypothetical protein GY841_04615 [FCB group bacterium]|nr:hypothetical protein [FCB group bacterium]